MESKPFLIVDRQKVRAIMGTTGKEMQQYIDTMKDWFKQQPHLPEVPSDELIEYFLITNKLSIERTKPKLDMYYTIRNLMPDVFRNQTPDKPHMKQTVNVACVCPLPKLTNELYRVSVAKIRGDVNLFNPVNFFSHNLNINEIRLQEDLNIGDIIIFDMEEMKIGHVVKFTPIQAKKAAFILEEVFSGRLKAIHFVNSPRYAEILIAIIKSVMKQKMIERIHVHADTKNLSKYISNDILPKDYGGNEMTVQELHDLCLSRLEVYKERLEHLDKIKINEILRPTPLVNDELLGYYGNFKKIDID